MLLAALAAAVIACGLPLPPAAAAARSPARPPVVVAVTALTPKVLTAQSTLTIAGTLTNRGEQVQRDLHVVVGIGGAITSRSALAGADDNPPPVVRSLGSSRDISTLAPRARPAGFSLTIPVRDLHLDQLGVYPLQVQAMSSRGLVGSVQTYLPWFPDQVAPTRLAWLWPLVDRPRRAADDVLTDDGLADELKPGGRLRGLLDAALAARRHRPAPVPVTLAIDPDLLATVASMTMPYQVTGADGHTQRGSGSQAAAGWLADLRALVAAGDPVIALPYADPDVVALQEAGLGGTLTAAIKAGAATVTDLLPKAKLADIAWPPAGAVTTRTLYTMNDAAPLGAVVLDESAVPLVTNRTYTVGALSPQSLLGHSLDALVADGGMTAVLDRDAASGLPPRLAEQRFLAETAMLTAERPTMSRDVLVAPPRRWNAAGYGAQLLADTGEVPWLAPTALGQVRTDPAPDVRRRSLRYPDQAARQQLAASYLGTVAKLSTSLTRFGAIVVDKALLRPLESGLWRSASTAWRDHLAGGERVRNATAATLRALRDKVQVTSGGRVVTLTSFSGTVPITIANELPSDVVVRVRVDARNRARLQSSASMVQRIPAHRREQVKVQVSAPAPGAFPVYVSLATETGVPLGDRVTLRVNVTAYGRLALAITVAALGVLLVAVGVRLTRRALASRRLT